LADAGNTLEERLAELERFAVLAAHELAAPLHVVAGYASLLEDTNLDPEQRDYVGRIAGTATRMQAMLDGLRRQLPGGEAPRIARVRLQAVVDDVRADVAPLLEEYGAELVAAAPLPDVAGDGVQLGSLLRNLVENAIKYGGGRVEIGAERRAGGWRISVRDNGPGIAPEDQQRIFEPFRRLREGRQRPGAGLGLWLCARIATAHGSRLELESAAGGPTTFSFTLPEAG
jgi:signal transduction histidine kinase